MRYAEEMMPPRRWRPGPMNQAVYEGRRRQMLAEVMESRDRTVGG